MATPLAQLLGARIAVYNAAHPRAPLDPRAVIGIASHEGLGGGIGDNGTSFGPFQLHLGGAYPMLAPHGSAAVDQAWASSPAGIDYALGRIGSVAGGMKGLPAITAISTRFERPANPTAEIQDAAAHYGLALPQLAGYGATDAPVSAATRKQPRGMVAAPQSSGPPAGLLANLLSSENDVGSVQPIPVSVPHFTPPQPLQNLLAMPQRQAYQPLLAGGH